MAAPFEELTDVSAFFAEIGENITYTPQAVGSTSRTIRAIFDDEFFGVEGIGAVTFDATAPQITVADADILGVEIEDAFNVRGVDFKATSVQPDGTGVTVIILAKA